MLPKIIKGVKPLLRRFNGKLDRSEMVGQYSGLTSEFSIWLGPNDDKPALLSQKALNATLLLETNYDGVLSV